MNLKVLIKAQRFRTFEYQELLKEVSEEYRVHSDLGDLVEGDMKFTLDYRLICASILSDWFKISLNGLVNTRAKTCYQFARYLIHICVFIFINSHHPKD